MDILPKKIIIVGLLVTVGLVLIFNYAFNHHYSYDGSKRFNLTQVSELAVSRVTIDHKERVESKLRTIVEGGKDKLQIILDFDKTLAKYKDEKGNLVKTTHDVFSSIETVPKIYREESYRLYNMYGPIELDPTISVEDKLPFMNQWVHEYEQLVKGIVMNSSLIEKAVNKTNLAVRDGAKEMLNLLKDNSVPVLIFSAGLGDVIKAALRVHSLNMSNVHVISNFFSYDKGQISGFRGKHIHAFNKNQRILEEIDFKYAKELSGRSNVILVGDSLGDASMADGLPHSSTIVRIAFLNNKINENMPYYKEMFDVVIAQDESMKIVTSILKHIIS